MFEEYIYGQAPIQFNSHILLIDSDDISKLTAYEDIFRNNGYCVVRYTDDLSLRIDYEDIIKHGSEKLLLIAAQEDYLPYDIRKCFMEYELSYAKLFPRLNCKVLREHSSSYNMDFLSYAYEKTYENMQSEEATEAFLNERVNNYINGYIEKVCEKIVTLSEHNTDCKLWQKLAADKAKVERLAVKNGLSLDFSIIDSNFQEYILENYNNLSTALDSASPVLVSRAMEYMYDHSEKFAVIVMDGMSVFDWEIIADSFGDICYRQEYAFAMIPTTTSISRQCLLSNKLPAQLESPWKQDKESKEFINCAGELGFAKTQIAYERGYNIEFDMAVRCGAIIINDIDDMVHGQKQGRKGMLNNIQLMAEEGKLKQLVKRLLTQNFDVYITADHGNAPSVGLGLLKGAGVQVETKSHKMLVLKDFADKEKWKAKYDMLEYPQYYLPKDYDYLICKHGTSMDVAGKAVMTHGGISLDEVVVPFIKIRSEDNK